MANDAKPPPGMGKNPYWPPDEYEFEDVERYHRGGFFPITIWPLLDHGRYCVVHKLGNGHFSTIWLAQDLHENRHVDLQIPTVDQYDVCREEEVLRAFWKHVGKSDVGYGRFFASLMGSFDHEGPNGIHHVCSLAFGEISLRLPT